MTWEQIRLAGHKIYQQTHLTHHKIDQQRHLASPDKSTLNRTQKRHDIRAHLTGHKISQEDTQHICKSQIFLEE